jgi:hypothetical protein
MSLLQEHRQYIAACKVRGEKTLTYIPPCCGQSIEDRAANEGETWDTLATCPHCEGLFFKVATAKQIVAHPVDGVGKAS